MNKNQLLGLAEGIVNLLDENKQQQQEIDFLLSKVAGLTTTCYYLKAGWTDDEINMGESPKEPRHLHAAIYKNLKDGRLHFSTLPTVFRLRDSKEYETLEELLKAIQNTSNDPL